jgi:cysteine desulfurase
MFANNEVGTIEPIKDLCEIAHKHGSLFHTDAVQAVGHVRIDVKELGVDMLSASAHKFNGPKGIGFLYVKKGTPISQYLSGGSQEFGLRAGTENVASIVGMAVALKKNCDAIEENAKHIWQLEAKLIDCLTKSGLDFIRNGAVQHIPGNISLSFRGADGEALLHRLDLMGICVSTGAACDTVNTQVSHVIDSINLDKNYAKGTIRVSLGKENTLDDVDCIVDALKKILSKR